MGIFINPDKWYSEKNEPIAECSCNRINQYNNLTIFQFEKFLSTF